MKLSVARADIGECHDRHISDKIAQHTNILECSTTDSELRIDWAI